MIVEAAAAHAQEVQKEHERLAGPRRGPPYDGKTERCGGVHVSWGRAAKPFHPLRTASTHSGSTAEAAGFRSDAPGGYVLLGPALQTRTSAAL